MESLKTLQFPWLAVSGALLVFETHMQIRPLRTKLRSSTEIRALNRGMRFLKLKETNVTIEENDQKTDDRSSMAKAIDRGTQVISACFLMVLPLFIGLWVDRKLGTVVLFTILGLIFGMAGGIWSLVKLVAATEKDDESGNGKKPKS